MFDEIKYPEPDPNRRPVADIWNERYASDQFLFGREPSLCVRNNFEFLRKGKCIDIAMGEGRNAVFLAQKGFNIEGVDASQRAIQKAKILAAEKAVTVEAKVQNLDFFLMPLMRYDTIVMTYYKPVARFFSEIRRGLVHGGTFLLEANTVDQVRHAPNPLVELGDCYKPNEALHLLRDFQILYYREIPDGTSYTVQAIALKNQK